MDGIRNAIDLWAAAWWDWVVDSSWQVALLAGVIWGINRLFRGQPASFRYALWLLVFLRLLLPPGLTAPWSVGTVAQRAAEVGGYGGWTVTLAPAPRTAPPTGAASTDTPPEMSGVDHTAARPRAAVSIPYQTLLFLLWLGVTAAITGTILLQYARFRRRVLHDSAGAPAWIQDLVSAQAARMRLARAPAVRVTAGAGVPAVFGALRPLVLIPEGWLAEFDRKALAGILTHELAHVKRRDLAVGWLASCLTCCYWFHPLVWVAHLQLRREREMACDDWVLRTTDTDGKDYAGTILKGAETAGGAVPAGAGFLGLMELSDNLLHRIRSAGDATRKRRMGLRSMLALGAVALALFPMQAISRATEDTAAAVPESREAELALYEKADPEVQAFIKHTMESFGRSNLWLDAGALDGLTPEEREKKIEYIAGVLDGEYGRHQCESLAEAGVIRDKRLLPGLKKVAAYHRDDHDYDCRAKWMAVAALGRQGDESAVPVLIPLVDHGNLNTRMWARGSLVRLTGQAFKDDKQAWGDWWNAQGKEPKLSADDLKPWVLPGADSAGGNAAATQPEIVSTNPAIGASGVASNQDSIFVTFDQDMAGGFSWTGGGEMYPETTGKPRWVDQRTCQLPVKLQEGRVYRVGINSKSHKNFRGANGIPARNRVLYFATQGADPEALAALTAPKIVSKVVGEDRDTLVVTFDKPMGPGGSWTQTGGLFPETTGKMQWSEDRTTCTLPVKLESGKTYSVGLNSAQHINFQSESGVPSEPEVWEFTVE